MLQLAILNLGMQLVSQACHLGDAVHASYSHDTCPPFPSRAGSLPSMSSSLSLTPGVETDRPVTPNDFRMSSACRGSDSHEMPSSVHSTILPSTRMLCTQSWHPEGPRNHRLVTTQISCNFKKNHLTLAMQHKGTKSSPCTHTRSRLSKCR